MDERDAPEYLTYKEYFKGRSIPFTVLIDDKGQAVKSWTGYISYADLVKSIKGIPGPVKPPLKG